jgi:hypothetical protein
MVGFFLAPSKIENLTAPGFFGFLAGCEASLSWWLAGSGSSLITRVFWDFVVGFLDIAILYQLIMTILFIAQARSNHIASKRNS